MPGALWRREMASRLQTRDDKPTSGASRVDQLLSAEARPCTQVGEVTFDGARPDAHELGRARQQPAWEEQLGGRAGLDGARTNPHTFRHIFAKLDLVRLGEARWYRLHYAPLDAPARRFSWSS